MKRALAWLGLVCCFTSPLLAADSKPLNILLLVADDMAPADFSGAGHAEVKTPQLDRLLKAGVRFTHAFTPNPICTPSRAAILTGQDCWTNDCYFFGRPIRETSVQFAQLLAKAGYETFYAGKWHNDGMPWERGFTKTLNVIRGGCPASVGGHEHPWVFDQGSKKKRQLDRFSSTVVSDAAVEFLKERQPGDRPFMMYVAYAAPHDPWTPPADYGAMYPVENISLPKNFLPRPAFRWFEDWHGTQLRDEALMPFPRTPAGVRDVRSRYFGMVSQMDTQIGRILDTLAEQKLTDQTLILFVADHGISLGSHGFSGKQTMYDEGIRLPMVMVHPKRQRTSATCSELVSLIDLFPTICEAAGVSVPKSVEGSSLLGLYDGSGKWSRQAIFAAFHSPEKHRLVSRAVRTKTHKYIVNLTTGEYELYDLTADPIEMANLAGQTDHAALEKQLASQLIQWRQQREPPAALNFRPGDQAPSR